VYADDTQMCTSLRTDAIDFTVIQQCTDDILRWYAENGMQMNPAKSESEAMAVGQDPGPGV
jgi:hypothetical protein